MAERHRSKDGSRDTEKVFGEEAAISHEGRDGGELARKKGTKDEMKRALEQPAGATRVRKSDEKESDDNE